MKNEIMNRLTAVLHALNHVSVMGKQNLDNLTGSISILENVAGILAGSDITPTAQEQPEETEGR